MNFTIDQSKAIDTHGKNIIVSAGAGSGKTAVLTERIYKMLLDGTDISRLLVLTFTNAAALEMKTRIKKRVLESGLLPDQVEKIDSAFITTFDSFSLSLVKKYHYMLSISKNISIIDASVVSLRKKEILDNIFEELYLEKEEGFVDILTKFTHKSDDDIKKSILNMAGKVDKIVDKEEYLNTYLETYYCDEVLNSKIKNFVNEVNERKRDMLLKAHELYDATIGTSCGESVAELIDFIKEDHSYGELYAFFTSFKFKSLPKGMSEEVKDLKDDFVKKEFDKFKKMYICYESEEEIYNSLLQTKPYVNTIIMILQKFYNRVWEYKKEKGLFEFDDIAMMSLKLLKDNPEILSEVKDSFDEILLDEYQDTSDIQESFMKLISKNNLYMVGDIKQSIYRFRNANPYIFKDKYDLYKEDEEKGIKIDLKENFRSRREVLNNINLLFSHLMHQETGDAEYAKEHIMNFGLSSYDEAKDASFDYNQEYLVYSPDDTKTFSNAEIETFIMAKKIKELVESKTQVFSKGKLRDIKYSDIAIILPRKNSIELITQIFTKEGIPTDVIIDKQITDSLMLRVLNSLFNLIRTVDSKDEMYGYYFMSIARSFLFNLSDNLLLSYSFDGYLTNEIADKARMVKEYSYNNSAIKTYDYMLDVFGVYEKLITIGDLDEHLEIINYINDMTDNLASAGYSFIDISKHTANIISDGLDLRISKENSGNGVLIMNIHKSKGLEYPVCFFADLNGGFNRMDIKETFLFDKSFGFITPYFDGRKTDTIDKLLYKNQYLKEDLSERIRLLYVAMTRAREKMYFVMPSYENLKVVANPFLFSSLTDFIAYYYDEAVKKYVKEVKYDDMVNKDYLEFKTPYLSRILQSEDKYSYDEITRNPKELEAGKISKKIDKLIDLDTSENIAFGTRMHNILQSVDLKSKDISSFSLTSKEKRLLDNLLKLDCFANLDNANVYKELEFIYNDLENSYHGIIDLLIEYDDHFEIIDYKLSDVNKEEYIRQLTVYKNYLNQISNKEVKTYLLSITKCTLNEVIVVE